MIKNRITSFLVALAITAAIFYSFEVEKVLNVILEVNYVDLMLAVSCLMLNYFFRAVRLQQLLIKHALSIKSAFNIVVEYGVANYFLPMKSGELAFPLLLKSKLNIELRESLKYLAKLKVLDLFMILVNFCLLFIYVEHSLLGILSGYVTLNTIILIMLIVIFLALIFKEKLRSLSLLVRQALVWKNMMLTLLILATLIGQFYFLAKSIGADFSIFLVMSILFIMVPLSLQPIQGIANIGPHEFAWIASATVFGIAMEQATQVAVATHLVLMAMMALLFISAKVMQWSASSTS